MNKISLQNKLSYFDLDYRVGLEELAKKMQGD